MTRMAEGLYILADSEQELYENFTEVLIYLLQGQNLSQHPVLNFPRIFVIMFHYFLGTMADDTNLQPVIGGAPSNFLQKSTTFLLLIQLILLAQLF